MSENNLLDTNVLEWYKSEYPADKWIAEEIPSSTTFNTVVECLNNGEDVYQIIAPDSICRERVFEHLSKITGQPYDYFYKQWLNSLNL